MLFKANMKIYPKNQGTVVSFSLQELDIISCEAFVRGSIVVSDCVGVHGIKFGALL